MRLSILTILSIASLLTFSGCNNTTPDIPKKIIPTDETLSVVSLTKNGVYSDINAIAFEWNSINDSRVKGIYVYKQSPNALDKNEHLLHKTIYSRFATHYVDNDIKPNTKYAYSFKTFSSEAQSKSSKIINVNSLPVIGSVSWIYAVTGMPRSAKIIWRPHTNKKVNIYIIERKSEKDKNFIKIAEVEGRLNAEYIDTKLQDNKLYLYRIRVKTFDNIISTPSKIVKVVTKILPKEIHNLKATVDLPKKIVLTWDASLDKDFHQYHLYRSIKDKNDYKLIATLFNNKFTDKISEDAKEYNYRISAIDLDGLESNYKKNTILGSTLAKPHTPILIKPILENGTIRILWNNIDARTKYYTIFKTEKRGWFKEFKEKIENHISSEFIDDSIHQGSTYSYKIIAVDKYGLVSHQSNEVSIKVLTDKIVKVQKNTFKEPLKIQQERKMLKAYEQKMKKTSQIKQKKNIIQNSLEVKPLEDININEK